MQTALKNRFQEKKIYQPNYLFIDSNFNILNYGTCGHAHKVLAHITKIQLTHKHNNKPTRHTNVHTALIDSTRLNLTPSTIILLHKRDSNIYGRGLWGSSSYIFGRLRHTLCSSLTCWCLLMVSCCAFN